MDRTPDTILAMSPSVDLDGIGLEIGDYVQSYRIVRALHEGGDFVGVTWVYEAVDENTQQRVAVKILERWASQDPDFLYNFLRCARFVQNISHPGLVKILDVSQHPDGMAYAILELLSGDLLGQRLRQMKSLSPAKVVDIGRQIADCLSYFHTAGAVYRDLEPGSVMLVSDAQRGDSEATKLVGFGSILKPGDVHLHPDGTPKMFFGSRHYMAPEAYVMWSVPDGKADVYSLGVLLYRMLCGRIPYESVDSEEVLAHKMRVPIPSLAAAAPKIPATLAKLVHQMQAIKPTDRPTMQQVVSELDILRDQLQSLTQ